MNVLTIHVFLCTAIVAMAEGLRDVAGACLLCYVIGMFAHSLKRDWLFTIDKVVVMSIASFYTLDCLRHVLKNKNGPTERGHYAVATIAVAAFTAAFYVVINIFHLPYLHPLVHVFASVGILFYIGFRSASAPLPTEGPAAVAP